MRLTWLRTHRMGDDLVLLLGGGEAHVGAVAVCEPGGEPQVVSLGTHREGEVAGPLARAVSHRTGRRVAVVAGIHHPSITRDQLEQVVRECTGYGETAGKDEL